VAVKLLFLGNSNDANPDIPEEQRSPARTAALLAEAIGEPVDVTMRNAWADAALPGLVEKWMLRYQPDIVLFKVNWYWYGYESVPAKVERVLGRVGSLPAKAGKRAAETPAIGHRRLFHQLRRLAYRFIGGDAPFSEQHVIDVSTAVIRKILAHEDVVLVVKGTATYHLDGEPAVADYRARFVRKRDRVEGTLAALCARLGVRWADNRNTGGLEHAGVEDGDGIHHDVGVQELMAGHHVRDLAEAWKAAGRQAASTREGPLAAR